MSKDIDIEFDPTIESDEFENAEDTAEIISTNIENLGGVDFMFDPYDDEPEPLSNVGRTECYWCFGSTVKKPLFSGFYDYCEKCGK